MIKKSVLSCVSGKYSTFHVFVPLFASFIRLFNFLILSYLSCSFLTANLWLIFKFTHIFGGQIR